MWRWGGAVVVVLLALAPTAGAVPAGSTVLADRPSGDGALPFDGAGFSFLNRHAMSQDGCYVAFTSESDALFAGDDDAVANVFRAHVCAPQIEIQQVNTTSAGVPSHSIGSTGGASISADGRYVAFTTRARDLDPAASSGANEVYRKDMVTGALELASRGVGADGAPATGVRDAVISGDGNAIAFIAQGPIDTDNVNGIASNDYAFVRYADVAQTHMVSLVNGTDTAPDGQTFLSLDIDHHGDRVAFVTNKQLSAGDSDTSTDAYVRRSINLNGDPEVTDLISGASSDFWTEAAISTDGGFAAYAGAGKLFFCNAIPCAGAAQISPDSINTSIGMAFFPATGPSTAPTRLFWVTDAALDPSDADGRYDLYGRLLGGLKTITNLTGSANGDVTVGDASDSTTVVTFDSVSSTNLPGSDGFTTQVYEGGLGSFRNLSQPENAAQANTAGQGSIGSLHPVSDDGHLVVFGSAASALGATPGTDHGPNTAVVARDVATATTTIVASGNGGSDGASVDAAGTKVAFLSNATDLPGGATNGFLHAYVRDLQTGALTLVDHAADGTQASKGVRRAVISPDGTKVAFISQAPNLPGAPADNLLHVYVADLASGTMTLADTGPNGPADDSAIELDVSGDANRVAFVSNAKNLGGATSGMYHVYLRDLAAGTTTWLSVPDPAGDATASASFPSISRDGSRVAFEGIGAAFPGGVDGRPRVFLRDVAAGTTKLISTGLQPDDLAQNASLDAAGTKITYTDFQASQLPRPFVLDLTSSTTTRADLRDGTSEPSNRGGSVAVVSGNGSCVVFSSPSTDLIAPPHYGPDAEHVYLRALGDCPVVPQQPGGTPKDTTPPVVSALRMTHRRFAVAKRSTALAARKRAPRGTAFRFRLSETARVTIGVARKQAGRRKGKRCVKPRKGLKRRCTRYVRKLVLTRSAIKAGAVRVAYTGRVRRKALKPGSYRATLLATDAAGNRSQPKRITFRVVRR